jgi:hypothetical protein
MCVGTDKGRLYCVYSVSLSVLSALLLRLTNVAVNVFLLRYHHLLMQGIHTYIPETNHVSRVYSVAAILRVL